PRAPMIAAYTPEGWGELFLAAAGATAALSGLIFVGLSVNIGTVLAIDKRQGQNFLTGRALEALAALVTVLVISLIGLVPAIPRGALAAFILLTGIGSAVSRVGKRVERTPPRRPQLEFVLDHGDQVRVRAEAPEHLRRDPEPAAGLRHHRLAHAQRLGQSLVPGERGRQVVERQVGGRVERAIRPGQPGSGRRGLAGRRPGRLRARVGESLAHGL